MDELSIANVLDYNLSKLVGVKNYILHFFNSRKKMCNKAFTSVPALIKYIECYHGEIIGFFFDDYKFNIEHNFIIFTRLEKLILGVEFNDIC